MKTPNLKLSFGATESFYCFYFSYFHIKRCLFLSLNARDYPVHNFALEHLARLQQECWTFVECKWCPDHLFM